MSHTASHTTAAGSHARGADAADGRGVANDVVVTEDGRVLNDPTHRTHLGHGNTPGGWLMAGLVVLGFALGCVGLLMDFFLLVWIGVGLMVLGAIAGFVSSKVESRESAHDADDERSHVDHDDRAAHTDRADQRVR